MNRKQFLRTSLVGGTAVAASPLRAHSGHEPLGRLPDTKVIKSGDGEPINVLGSRIHLKLTGADTYGLTCMIEDFNEPGIGIPLHVHTREDEVFRVLEGRVEFTLGTETLILTAGDVAFAPRNVPHAWRVVGDEPARSIMVANPAGIEHMFAELGKLPGGKPDLGKVAAVCGRYGISFL